jgi:hypothetical protein
MAVLDAWIANAGTIKIVSQLATIPNAYISTAQIDSTVATAVSDAESGNGWPPAAVANAVSRRQSTARVWASPNGVSIGGNWSDVILMHPELHWLNKVMRVNQITNRTVLSQMIHTGTPPYTFPTAALEGADALQILSDACGFQLPAPVKIGSLIHTASEAATPAPIYNAFAQDMAEGKLIVAVALWPGGGITGYTLWGVFDSPPGMLGVDALVYATSSHFAEPEDVYYRLTLPVAIQAQPGWLDALTETLPIYSPVADAAWSNYQNIYFQGQWDTPEGVWGKWLDKDQGPTPPVPWLHVYVAIPSPHTTAGERLIQSWTDLNLGPDRYGICSASGYTHLGDPEFVEATTFIGPTTFAGGQLTVASKVAALRWLGASLANR